MAGFEALKCIAKARRGDFQKRLRGRGCWWQWKKLQQRGAGEGQEAVGNRCRGKAAELRTPWAARARVGEKRVRVVELELLVNARANASANAGKLLCASAEGDRSRGRGSLRWVSWGLLGSGSTRIRGSGSTGCCCSLCKCWRWLLRQSWNLLLSLLLLLLSLLLSLLLLLLSLLLSLLLLLLRLLLSLLLLLLQRRS